MSHTSFQQACIFAQVIHEGKQRLTGEAFIEHPKAVMNILKNMDVPSEYLQVALLHDVLEESNLSQKELESFFGLFVSQCVSYLSKDFYITYEKRIEKYMEKLQKGVKFHECVYLVKLADVYHNMQTLHGFEAEKQRRQTEEVYRQYLPFFHDYFLYVQQKYRQPVRQILREITSMCIGMRKSCC